MEAEDKEQMENMEDAGAKAEENLIQTEQQNQEEEQELEQTQQKETIAKQEAIDGNEDNAEEDPQNNSYFVRDGDKEQISLSDGTNDLKLQETSQEINMSGGSEQQVPSEKVSSPSPLNGGKSEREDGSGADASETVQESGSVPLNVDRIQNLKEVGELESNTDDRSKSDCSNIVDERGSKGGEKDYRSSEALVDEKEDEDNAVNNDTLGEVSGIPDSIADGKQPEDQTNVITNEEAISEPSPIGDQAAVRDDSAETKSSSPESQSGGQPDVTHESSAGELPLRTIEDNLRPYTSHTMMSDRPISMSSFVYSAKDFPTPDYDQFIRPTPSVAEVDKDRSESKASRPMKSATSRGDGTKSVTFAEDVKSDESIKSSSVSQAGESAADKEEIFTTAVSEEKIEEATKKLRSGSADSWGSGNSLLKEVFGLERIKLVSGSDLINKRANEHYDRGCTLSSSGDLFPAIISFDKAINLCPSEVRFYLMRGETYLQVTDFQSAIQSFKKACVLRPTSEMYYTKLAFVYYLQGQSLFDQCLFTEALESFSRAAEMRPEIIGYHTRSIACLAALERHGECLALVNKRLEVERSNPDLYIMRARLHLLFRNTSLSYYDLKDALALNPDQQEAQKLLRDLEKKAQENRDFAIRLQLLEKFKEAMQKITLAIEMNPSVAEFHLLRGAIHRRLHDFNAAIDDFLLALDKTDHDESDKIYMDAQRQLLLTYNDFAVDCFLGGHFDEAILLLNKAIKGEKREKGLYVNRGDCFFRLGELHFSLADYHQALELDPHDSMVRARIAAIHGEFGSIDYEEHSYQDAEARFTVAIQHNPKHSQFYLSRAKVRFMLENHSGARQDILISLHLNPNNDAIHSLLARLFPGKSVPDVMKSKAAKEAKHALDRAVVTASPVKLPAIARLAGSGLLQSLDLLTSNSKVTEEETSPFVLFLNEDEFNKVLARRKKKVAVEVKSSLQDRQSLKRSGPKLKPQPPPRAYQSKGGHWKHADTQPPPGWRQFGLGIEMKDS